MKRTIPDKIVRGTKALLGIKALVSSQTIYQKTLHVKSNRQFILEIEFESYMSCDLLCLRTIYQQGMSRKSKAYTWTVADFKHPQQWLEITSKILQASHHYSATHSQNLSSLEVRGWWSQAWDKLLQEKHLRTLPNLAQQTKPFPQQLSAELKQRKSGIWVTLRYQRSKGRATLYQEMPIEAVQALHDHLLKSAIV